MCFSDYLCPLLILDPGAVAGKLLSFHVSPKTNKYSWWECSLTQSLTLCSFVATHLYLGICGDSLSQSLVVNRARRVLVCYLIVDLLVLRWWFGKIPKLCFSQPLSQNLDSFWIYIYEKKNQCSSYWVSGPPQTWDDNCCSSALSAWSQLRHLAWFLHRPWCILLWGLYLALCFDIVPSQYIEYFPV